MTDSMGWRTDFDRTISAFHEGAMAEGRLACDRVLGYPETPEDIRVVARRNAVHYAPELRELLPAYRDWPNPVEVPEGWFAFNPSLVADGDGYLLAVRCANYAMPGWVTAPGDDHYRSRVALVPLDAAGWPAGPARFLTEARTDRRARLSS